MSHRIENAEQADDIDAADSSRRGFLAKLWMALGLLALVESAGVVIAYLRPHKRRARAGSFEPIIEAGPVRRFPLDSVTAFVGGKFYLARMNDGGFLALSRKCTHLGCTVLWSSQDKKFECPCHSSKYNIRGEVLDPPAPRALDTYRVSIQNDVVSVHLGKRIKRSSFDHSHVAYPKKT